MSPPDSDALPAASWHRLLAPLPTGATPARTPVAQAAVTDTPEGRAIAGWEQLVVTLTAGPAGLRNVLVVLDAHGRPIAASDHVLYRDELSSGGSLTIRYQHVSIGGRIEADGSFRGTCWHSTTMESAAGERLETASESSAPTSVQVADLRTLINDLVERAPPSPFDP